MWMRLLATTRRPACSRRSMILPVILRLVASGLMIEKVRSLAMDSGSPLIALAGDCLAGDCSGWAQPLGAAGGAGPPQLHFAPGFLTPCPARATPAWPARRAFPHPPRPANP